MPENAVPGTFEGRASTLFGLALRTAFFTLLTLGIYRFWMKTRLRRWYWSSVRIGGLPMEYTGDPIEKLLGFLFAVVILAFYIGIVNLILMFASFSLFQGNVVAYLSSFVGVIPIWFYAQYRARRYVLARTRWRGMRFGLEPGAWGYAGRALIHWALTLITLGLLWPRMTFYLEKYKTDRTFFGDQRLHQGGRWQMLYAATRWIWVTIALGLGIFAAFASGSAGLGIALGLIAVPLAGYGIAYYRVRCRILLTQTKTLGDIALTLDASPPRIFLISIFGSALASLVFLVPVMILVAVLAGIAGTAISIDLTNPDFGFLTQNQTLVLIVGGLFYFSVFLMWTTLTHVFVTMPIFRHYAQRLTVTGADGLDSIHQRPRDAHAEAEGFAEALDVGASI